MTSSKNARRVSRHRHKLREQGLRPVQIWVPDTRAPSFAEEAARQARRLAASQANAELIDFLENIAAAEEYWDEHP